MNLRIFFAIALTFIVSVSGAQDKRLTIAEQTYGCTQKDDMAEVVDLITDGDDAWATFLAQKMLLGDCRIFEADETVYLKDAALFSSFMQVRLVGDPRKWWVLRHTVNR